MDLFFYGTLPYIPLLECVLGRSAAQIDLEPAALDYHRVSWAAGQSFPMIHAEEMAQADGLLVRDLSETDLSRLRFYEGGFDYDVKECAVMTATGDTSVAWVFFPTPGAWEAGEVWSLDRWIDDWADVSVLAATEAMAHFGRRSVEQMQVSMPAIRMRAAASLAARKRSADPARDVDADVVVHRHKRPYINYFGFDEVDLQYLQHDGSFSPIINRGAVRTGQAACVLPYDPKLDAVLLIEQFRAPPFLLGDRAPWIKETVAGMIEPGETAEDAAHRETMEEAGLTLSALLPAGQAYSSTGASTEYVHLFVGLADLSAVPDHGGVASEGENIKSDVIDYPTFFHMLETDQFRALPLVTLANWLARHRQRLRADS